MDDSGLCRKPSNQMFNLKYRVLHKIRTFMYRLAIVGNESLNTVQNWPAQISGEARGCSAVPLPTLCVPSLQRL